MKKIKITCQGNRYAPLNDLIDFQGNLKELKKAELKKLQRSILRNGFSFPVFVWNDFIIDGHQRIFATNELLKEGYSIGNIPVVDIEAKDKKDAAEKLLFLNSRYAQVTNEGLVDFINEYSIDISEFASDIVLPEIDMDRFMQDWDSDGLTDDDNIPDVEDEAKTKIGDLYAMGNHRLLCGDSTKQKDVARLMNGQKADMVFTDPPYGVSYGDKNVFLNAIWPANRIQENIKNDTLSSADSKSLWTDAFNAMRSAMKKGAAFYICSADSDLLMMMMMSINDANLNLKQSLVWVKNNIVIGRRDYKAQHENMLYGWNEVGHKFYGPSGASSVWRLNKPQQSKLHPTMKPVELVETAINNSSKAEDIILDIFTGSGTTIIASEKTGRIAHGMEIDPHYCDVIVKRWEDYTGKKAELIKE